VNAPGAAAWDHAADDVVVGSGNGAMTAVLCRHEMRLPDTLVVEKSERYGGASLISGGGVRIPNNHLAAAAGARDSVKDARAYLEATLPAHIAPEYIEAYLREGPRMTRFLHERTRVRYRSLALYPDYYTDRPGARTGHRPMEPEPIGGLYATGNCSAALLPTYPGPGATLGPAMPFAWQATRHLTGWTG